jgi:hypothetical protein
MENMFPKFELVPIITYFMILAKVRRPSRPPFTSTSRSFLRWMLDAASLATSTAPSTDTPTSATCSEGASQPNVLICSFQHVSFGPRLGEVIGLQRSPNQARRRASVEREESRWHPPPVVIDAALLDQETVWIDLLGVSHRAPAHRAVCTKVYQASAQRRFRQAKSPHFRGFCETGWSG